jgi:hypothetical protein
MTIECHDCGFCTDVEVTSNTNPATCPECGGELFAAGTDIPLYGEDGEINPVLCDAD